MKTMVERRGNFWRDKHEWMRRGREEEWRSGGRAKLSVTHSTG